MWIAQSLIREEIIEMKDIDYDLTALKIMVIIGCFILGIIFIRESFLMKELQTMNLPNEVVAGQIKNSVVTTESSRTNSITTKIVLNFCSGTMWVVPNDQLSIIEDWIQVKNILKIFHRPPCE